MVVFDVFMSYCFECLKQQRYVYVLYKTICLNRTN